MRNVKVVICLLFLCVGCGASVGKMGNRHSILVSKTDWNGAFRGLKTDEKGKSKYKVLLAHGSNTSPAVIWNGEEVPMGDLNAAAEKGGFVGVIMSCRHGDEFQVTEYQNPTVWPVETLSGPKMRYWSIKKTLFRDGRWPNLLFFSPRGYILQVNTKKRSALRAFFEDPGGFKIIEETVLRTAGSGGTAGGTTGTGG